MLRDPGIWGCSEESDTFSTLKDSQSRGRDGHIIKRGSVQRDMLSAVWAPRSRLWPRECAVLSFTEPLPTVWFWAGYLTSLCFRFLFHNLELMMVIVHGGAWHTALNRHEQLCFSGQWKKNGQEDCTKEVAFELIVKEWVSPGGRKSFQAKKIRTDIK